MGGVGGGAIFFAWLSSSRLDLVIADVKWHPIAFTMGLEGCQQATASTRQLEHFPGRRMSAKSVWMILWPFAVILANEGNGTFRCWSQRSDYLLLVLSLLFSVFGSIYWGIAFVCFSIDVNWQTDKLTSDGTLLITICEASTESPRALQLAVSPRGPHASVVPAPFTHKTTVAFNKQSCTMCF